MVKKNYQAWQADTTPLADDLTEKAKLLRIASLGILAPSGHNTQPWKLIPRSNTLEVHINRAHYLPIDGSGLKSVEPYVSVGTFIETFVQAAAGFGYKAVVDLDMNGDRVVILSLSGKQPAQPDLLKAIVARASNRTPFDPKPLPEAKVKELLGGALTGVRSTVITSRPDVEFIAQQTEIAITTIMSNPDYRQELSKWVRSNQTRQYDGMPGFTHGFGSLKSLASKVAVKHAKKQGPQAQHSAELIINSGALVIVRCQNDELESFVNAGRLYARACILAQVAGLSTSGLGAAVLDGSTRETVKKHFSITDRPIFILRVGKTAVKPRHAPRWPLEKLLG